MKGRYFLVLFRIRGNLEGAPKRGRREEGGSDVSTISVLV